MPPRLLALIALAAAAQAAPRLTQGQLTSLDSEGIPRAECPLKHTAVKAEISGFLARVTATQEFQNPLNEKIEAVYTFPLPQRAAVDDMVMLVGNRTVRAVIKRREEARQIYEQARARGNVASLLDQERPNIFTQHVANIMPGETVKITLSYVETLEYEDGTYEFVFPMVVGPRYIPGRPTGRQGGGWSPDTDRVPDASHITPPVAPPGTRAGHDISVEIALDAGLPIDRLECPTHEVAAERPGVDRARVRLKDQNVIPNKDFILRYEVAGRRITDAVLAHRGARGGFFSLILQPPERVTVAEITPKELVFVIDTSGSMSGFPIEKAKEAMRYAIDGLNPQDTFNLITFSGDTSILFPEPVPATPDNIRRAQDFLASKRGSGGTEMMKAIRAALDPSDSQEHVRVVCFMTDGYVGNDREIIAEIQRHANARVFSFGIGASVNRFLLDNMARQGRGEVEYVGLNDDGSKAAKRFYERVRNPLLTDIAIDWNGLPVSDVQPARIPDLFGAKPVVITGRYNGSVTGTIRLRGRMAGREFAREIRLNLPAAEPRHDVLASLWARRKIEALSPQHWSSTAMGDDTREAIVKLGLEFRLMTEFTSFVAVEERIVTEGGQPRTVQVPVGMPEGVSHEGVFGEQQSAFRQTKLMAAPSRGFTGGFIPGAAPNAPMAAERRREMAPRADAENAQILEKDKGFAAKLAPSLLQAFRNGRPGKIAVQVMLNELTPAVMAQLRALGFEVLAEPKTGRITTGRIEVAKLQKLAELKVVKYVSAL
ncbi:MAG TPA: VIT and VWA domain-containing protein [Bryobacteraceae bacterium]|nr:VIT and VWA domain-containing protein [Bryobacteraceae bacterium]